MALLFLFSVGKCCRRFCFVWTSLNCSFGDKDRCKVSERVEKLSRERKKHFCGKTIWGLKRFEIWNNLRNKFETTSSKTSFKLKEMYYPILEVEIKRLTYSMISLDESLKDKGRSRQVCKQNQCGKLVPQSASNNFWV